MGEVIDALFLSAVVFIIAGGYVALIRHAIRELKNTHGESWKQHFPWGEAAMFLALALAIGWPALESLSQMLK